jgi:hypothetical protein
MTSIDISAINGHLLGDGSVLNPEPKRKKTCVFSHTSSKQDYSLWIINNTLGLDLRPVWVRKYLDERTNKVYTSYWFRSRANSLFTELRSLWYSNGTKEVPKNLSIDALCLQRWFLDDGSLATKGGVYLSTDGFNQSSLDHLCNELDKFGLLPSLHKNDSNYRIYIPKYRTYKFFQVIGDCPLESMQYKWKG